jgi:endonuclease YncB( thermonuclease family)
MSRRSGTHRPFVLVLLILGVAVQAATATQSLDARVVKVTDGDSLEVRDSNGLVHRVRLGGIDAPSMRSRSATARART